MMKRLCLAFVAVTLTLPASAQQPEVKERIIFRGHTGSVTSLVFTDQGKVLASASSDKTVRLWDLTDEKRHGTLNGHEHSVQALAATSDSGTLASADDSGIVKLWDIAARKERRTLRQLKGGVNSLGFSPSGKILASGGGGFDKVAEMAWSELKLWDVEKGEQIADLEGHPTGVKSLAFAPDGKTLASCSADGTTIIWQTNAPYRKTVLGKNPKGAISVAFSPNGKIVACGSFTESTLVKFWDATSGKELPSFEDPFGAFLISLSYLPNGKTLVLGGMKQRAILDQDDLGSYLALWDTSARRERLVIKGHFRAILTTKTNADGTLLATGGLDNDISLWELTGTNK